MLTKFGVVLAVALALILVALACIVWFVPQVNESSANIGSNAEGAPALAPPATSAPLTAPATAAAEPTSPIAPALRPIESDEPVGGSESTASLDEPCHLTGSIRDTDQRPVAGQELWLLRANPAQRLYFETSDRTQVIYLTVSDAQGHFAFHGVRSGTWRLGAAAFDRHANPDGAAIPDSVVARATEVRIPEGALQQTADLVVYRGLIIRGTVLDPDGAPCPNVRVYARFEQMMVKAQTGSKGQFVLGPLVAGKWVLRTDTRSEAEETAPEPVQVEPGAIDVVLRLQRIATLSGRVVDATTGIACSARLVLSFPDDPVDNLSMHMTEPDGSFLIKSSLLGRNALVARTADGKTGVLPDVRLTGGARIEGLVIKVTASAVLRAINRHKQSGVGVRVLQNGLTVDFVLIKSAASKTLPVPAGPLHVQCFVNEKQAELEQDLTLAVGEEREIVSKDDD